MSSIMREDWIECTLNDIAKWGSGGTPKSTNPDYYNGNIPWLIIGDLNDSYVTESQKSIAKLGLDNSSAKLVNANSVLIAMYGSIGKLGINKIEVATNQAIAFTQKLYSGIYNKYLFHYLFYSRPTLHSQGKGGTQRNISQTVLKKFPFPLIPLVEQKAIVKKIEELFSSLDSGIADLKKAQDQLKIYRQAVLKKAFEGDWEKVELGEVCEKASKVKRKEMPLDKTLKYLDIGGIDNNFNKIISHKEYTWENAPSRAQQIVKVGDVLFSTVRTYLKNIARIEKHIYENEIASSGFTVIRGKKDVLISKFIFFIATSQFFLEPLNKLQRGTSYPAVRDSDVFSQKIPLPSLKQQHQIVQEIESRLSVCDAVEQNIKDSLEKSQALRQSILKKAFEGKLLSEEEIAACKQHKDYEPASILLEKIKVEKKQK